MSAQFKQTIKRGDTKRKIRDTLTLAGSTLDLTGATAYLIIKSTVSGSTAVRRAATITDEAAGKLEYQFVAEDVAVAGQFQLEWEINFPDDTVLTVPQDSYIQLIIMEDLG